ncbi:hypothetical protein Hanom_Chr15g01377851 [Helianthus anomalus]
MFYVDSVRCNGMDMDYTIYPITFWSKNKLKEREWLEIKPGEFHVGELKRLTSCKKMKDENEPTI